MDTPLTNQHLIAGTKYYQIVCTAPVNIAVIKYWGKRDVALNLPINSSLSGTLHQDDMKTTTTATAFKISSAEQFPEDLFFLNGERQSLSGLRMKSCMDELKSRAQDIVDPQSLATAITPEDWKTGKARLIIESHNNFPTAAGLASSAAGFACLVASVGRLLNVDGDLTAIARRGSGSASRSLYGGWVKWEMGEKADGSDSIALQVADELHWPQAKVLIFVVSGQKKDVGSTDGMQQSVATSPLIPERIQVVPERMRQMEKAILERDFDTFAHLTMLDSDHFHQVCHTSEPAIHYMNDTSRFITNLVRAYNDTLPHPVVAYTFDAGPNAVLYIQQQHILAFLRLASHYLSLHDHLSAGSEEDRRMLLRTRDASLLSALLKEDLREIPSLHDLEPLPFGSVSYVIHTEVGPGPISSEVISFSRD